MHFSDYNIFGECLDYVIHETSIGGVYEMVGGCTFWITIYLANAGIMLHMGQALGAFMKWSADALFGLQYIWQMLGLCYTWDKHWGHL